MPYVPHDILAAHHYDEPPDYDPDDDVTPEASPVWLPCTICGQNQVCASDGYDTCKSCLDSRI